MPRPRKPPRIYRRPGRRGFFAYLGRDARDIPLGTDDEAEAALKLSELLEQRGLRAAGPISSGPTLAACFAEHVERSKAGGTPKSTYQAWLNGRRVLKWLEEHGTTRPEQVTKELIEAYKQQRRFTKSRRTGEGISPARINREVSTWRQAMKVAWELKAVPKRILDDFVRMREPRPQPHMVGLSKDEIGRFLKAVPHPGYRALFRTVIGTGMRDDEVRHLDDTDIQPPWIVVTPKRGWTGKSWHYRQIPASPATVKAARTFLAAKADMSLEAKAVWRILQAARMAAGIDKHFSLHDLRRAWASHMLRAGHRLEDIQKWLGHREITTTMRYLRVVSTAAPNARTLPF